MLNQKSIDTVNASTFSKQFRKPLYESYSFANIPGTIEKALVGETGLSGLPVDVFEGLPQKYDKVILLFVDAFGWKFFESYKERFPFLNRILTQGVASKLTSQFPSTTAAHVTTIHTGERVDQSGVFEWFYYEPTLDAMIAPLLFSFAGEKIRDTLKETGIDPKELYPTHTFYQRLSEKGVRSYLYQSKEYAFSPYSTIVSDGAQVFPYTTLSEALTRLSYDIRHENGKAYFYVYFANIDSIGHKYGPSSAEFDAEVVAFFATLEEVLYPNIQGIPDTLLLMTADHGQANIDPEKTIYLNKELPEISEWMRKNKKGDLLVPGGSCRDMFLYIEEEHVAQAKVALEKLLEGKAEVRLVSDLMKQNFFGDAPSDVLKARIGNLCILPYAGESVWWWEEGKFEQHYYGHHGGLTPAEMDTIFLALAL